MGFFGGLAGSFEQHQRRKQEKENLEMEGQMSMLRYAAQTAEKNDDPVALAAVLRTIGQYSAAEGLKGKKGKQQRSDIMNQFSDLLLKGREEKVPDMEKGAPPGFYYDPKVGAYLPSKPMDEHEAKVALENAEMSRGGLGGALSKATRPRRASDIPTKTEKKPLFKSYAERQKEAFEAEKPELEFKAQLAMEKEILKQEEITKRTLSAIDARAQFDQARDERRATLRSQGKVRELASSYIAQSVGPDGVPTISLPEAEKKAADEIIKEHENKQRQFDDKHNTAVSNIKNAERRLNDQERRTDSMVRSASYLNRKRELEPKISGARSELKRAGDSIQQLLVLRDRAIANTTKENMEQMTQFINNINSQLESNYAKEENARKALQEAADSLQQASGSPASESKIPKSLPEMPTKPKASAAAAKAGGRKVDQRVGRTVKGKDGRTGTIRRINPDGTAEVEWH